MLSSMSNFMPQAPRATHVDSRRTGALVIVGSGIQFAGHATLASERAIRDADWVFFAVADPWAAGWIRSLNAQAESLPYPASTPRRRDIYEAMVELILAKVRAGMRVAAVFYGSPAILTQPAHAALRRAREEGFRALMLPGVSFLECLFTQAEFDPGEKGCHFLDAGVFVREKRTLDVRAHVVLSQIAFVCKRGVFTAHDAEVSEGLRALQYALLDFYPREHVATLYEAATNPLDLPRMEPIRLAELARAGVTGLSTLHIPPGSSVS